MAEIIDLRERREIIRGSQLLVEWARALGFSIGPECSIGDLPDSLLWLLAKADPKGQSELEKLILLVRKGKKAPSKILDPEERIELLDVTLFLLDHIRFECMRRLGWIETMEANKIPLAKLLSESVEGLKEMKQIPSLKEDNPNFYRFQSLPTMEKDSFIRRQIPQALEIFRRRLEQKE